jgi:hypothetical protein
MFERMCFKDIPLIVSAQTRQEQMTSYEIKALVFFANSKSVKQRLSTSDISMIHQI